MPSLSLKASSLALLLVAVVGTSAPAAEGPSTWNFALSGANNPARQNAAMRLPIGGVKHVVYGYLLGTVHDDGAIDFNFKEIDESAIPSDVIARFGPALVHECFVGNSDVRH